MDKSDLRKAAKQLATIEVYERICEPSERAELEKSRITQLEEVNKIRASIPELAGKEYWWDVPFDKDNPPYTDEDNYFIPNSFYVEYGDIITRGMIPHIQVDVKEDQLNVTQFLNLVRGGVTQNHYYNTLYIDKKMLRQNMSATLTVRVLYNIAYDSVSLSSLEWTPEDYINIRGVDNVIDRVNISEQMRLNESSDSWDRQLDSLNNLWDLKEKLWHSSIYNNDMRYMMGRMDTRDYVKESIWRDYDIITKREKAIEEQAQIRAEAMRERNRLQEIQSRALSRSIQRTSSKANYIHLLRACEIYYLNGQIVAICAYKEKQEPLDAACSSEIDLSDLTGSWAGIKKGKPVCPDYYKLYNYIIAQYSRYLPKYKVLSTRPTGASDKEWRTWAELRFMNNMLADL